MTFHKKIFAGLFAVIMIFGVAPFGVMYFLQSVFVFPVPDVSVPGEAVGVFAPVDIPSTDGVVLRAWEHRAEDGEASVLVFHGNADLAVRQRALGAALADAGFGVLLAEYRGYGGSTGEPSQQGVIDDGLATYDYLRASTAGPIGVYAHSLGTAVAIPVAAAREMFAVVLSAPMTSINDIARYRMGWMPDMMLADWMIRYPFRSDYRIGEVSAPLLILHGTADIVVPFNLGQRLASLAPAGTRFVGIEGAGHNNLLDFGVIDLTVAFLTQAEEARE